MDPKVASKGSWIFSDKANLQLPFKAIDDSTFQITLAIPFPAMMRILTMQYCSVVPKEVARNEVYRQMDELVMEEAPVVPLYYDQVIRFVQKNVTGLLNNPMNLLEIKKSEN